jgi:ferredoxin-type protein NapH
MKEVMVAMAKKKSISLTVRLARWRIWVQGAFLFVWMAPMARIHTVCSPVFHCHSCPLATFVCPIGVLAHFSALHVIPYLAIGTLLVVGVLLGGFVCGWICPFGLFQDLLGRIPTPKFALPAWTGTIRFVILGLLVLAIPYWFGEQHPLFICRLCPAGALEAAFPNTAALALAGQPLSWPTATKTIIFVVFLLLALFTYRPWCTALCPLGAIYSLCNSFSFIFVRVDQEECGDCGVCKSLCQYGDGPLQRANDLRCIRCLDCTKCRSVTVASVLSRSPAVGAGAGERQSELMAITIPERTEEG